MKILKHGKVERRKFVCHDCGCEFVAKRKETINQNYRDFIFCPTCERRLIWEDGELMITAQGSKDAVEVHKGEWTVIQATNNHVAILRNGKRVAHFQCNDKKSEQALLEMIDFYQEVVGGEI